MQARRLENEAARAADCDRLEHLIADRVIARTVDEQHVEADSSNTHTIELVEEVRVTLPAPRPAAFAARPEMFDRTFVDLDDNDSAGRFRLERSPLHDGIEDCILGGA